jgi:hypothetical protein
MLEMASWMRWVLRRSRSRNARILALVRERLRKKQLVSLSPCRITFLRLRRKLLKMMIILSLAQARRLPLINLRRLRKQLKMYKNSLLSQKVLPPLNLL